MDVRHFRYVTALAQEMNFSAAAKRLHIAQPALSQNIRQVEEELGVKLFERSTRKVALTDAGRAFYREALMILAKVENAKRTALRAASGEIGSLTIGFTTTSILGGELTRRLRVFQKRYPDIRITLEDFTVNKLMNRLRTSAIDVACTEGIYPDDSLETQALKPLPVVLALYKGHPLAKRRHLRLSMLAKEHFILPVPFRAWAVYEAFVRFCEQAGFKPVHADYASNAVGSGWDGRRQSRRGDAARASSLSLSRGRRSQASRAEPDLANVLCMAKGRVSLPAKNFIHLTQ